MYVCFILRTIVDYVQISICIIYISTYVYIYMNVTILLFIHMILHTFTPMYVSSVIFESSPSSPVKPPSRDGRNSSELGGTTNRSVFHSGVAQRCVFCLETTRY